MRYTYKISLLLVLVFSGLIAAFLIPPMAQDVAYHNFVDQRTLHGIDNFWDVMSTLPFILFGLIGLYSSSKTIRPDRLQQLQWLYTLFFTAAIFVGIGSGYYHLDPSNDTLVWDRLPMTIAFMAFFSIVLAEYVSFNTGRLLFLPLLAAGMISVIYWYKTEQLGAGDLRPYALIQFLPMILMPVILVLFNTGRQHTAYIWLVLVAYALSKLSEYFDAEIYQFTAQISGHSLKHVLASLGILFFYLYFTKRKTSHD